MIPEIKLVRTVINDQANEELYTVYGFGWLTFDPEKPDVVVAIDELTSSDLDQNLFSEDQGEIKIFVNAMHAALSGPLYDVRSKSIVEG